MDLELVDHSRSDPYSNASQRLLPISVISPIGPLADCEAVSLAYMPYSTAAYWEQAFPALYNLPIPLNNTLTATQLSVCRPISNHATTTSTASEFPLNPAYPVILFSPGLGLNRQLYHILCTNLASLGFNIITVDAPGQTNVLTLSDESVQHGNSTIISSEQVTLAVEVRVADLNFILDSMRLPSSSPPTNNQSPSYMGKHPGQAPLAGIFGHSFGGAAALSLMLNNTHIPQAADLDGGLHNAFHAFDLP